MRWGVSENLATLLILLIEQLGDILAITVLLSLEKIHVDTSSHICCVGFASLDVVCDELNECAWNLGL